MGVHSRPSRPTSLMSTGDVRLDGPMERIEAELFTDGGNGAVVCVPGGSFPGVLVQGDSLRSSVAKWPRWRKQASEATSMKLGTPPTSFWRTWMLCWRGTWQRCASTSFRDRTDLSGHQLGNLWASGGGMGVIHSLLTPRSCPVRTTEAEVHGGTPSANRGAVTYWAGELLNGSIHFGSSAETTPPTSYGTTSGHGSPTPRRVNMFLMNGQFPRLSILARRRGRLRSVATGLTKGYLR